MAEAETETAAPAPDAAPAPEPKAGGTLTTGADPTQTAEAPSDWGDDWRDKIAGKDDKEMARLKRFGSPKDIYNAYRQAEGKLSSGGKPEPLPADATPEQVEAYREANGIPKTVDGYFDSMPEGVVLGEADREMAKGFAESMHAKNMPPEVVHAGLQWYQDLATKAVEEQQQKDLEFRAATTDALKQEYGGEFIARLNSVKNLLNGAPPLEDGTPFAAVLETARMPDGRLLGDHPSMLKLFADMAYQINPAGFVAPSDGAGQLESVEAEMASLKSQMGNPKSDYWKDPKKQARYRQLVDAQERLK